MKKTTSAFIAILLISLYSSCAAHRGPGDIEAAGYARAFSHLWNDTNFSWLSVVFTLILFAWMAYTYFVTANKEVQDETMRIPFIALAFGLIIIWIGIPASLGQETSLEHALQNKWGW